MAAYILRRLAYFIPTLLAIYTAAFLLMHAAPGSPFGDEKGLLPEVLAVRQAEFHLDKPLWQQYEGTIISAIRTAEKLVPDDTQNASLAKFDAALQFVLKVFEERNNRQATIAEKAALQEGINILHNKLDGAGALNVPSGAATPAEVRS